MSTRRSLHRLYLAAAAAWLLGAAVFLTADGSASAASTSVQSERHAATAAAVIQPRDLAARGGTIGQLTQVWSLEGFANDLRKPRPPRQRSERPTTGADGVAEMISASLLRLILCIDLQHQFIRTADAVGPLTGHYQSLLRPPALVS
jgi:hypothetical protein